MVTVPPLWPPELLPVLAPELLPVPAAPVLDVEELQAATAATVPQSKAAPSGLRYLFNSLPPAI
jgi:hypothetical protein